MRKWRLSEASEGEFLLWLWRIGLMIWPVSLETLVPFPTWCNKWRIQHCCLYGSDPVLSLGTSIRRGGGRKRKKKTQNRHQKEFKLLACLTRGSRTSVRTLWHLVYGALKPRMIFPFFILLFFNVGWISLNIEWPEWWPQSTTLHSILEIFTFL